MCQFIAYVFHSLLLYFLVRDVVVLTCVVVTCVNTTHVCFYIAVLVIAYQTVGPDLFSFGGVLRNDLT